MWLVCVSACLHNASSADPSIHRLLHCTTALLSSLISSVNAGLWLIENELVYVSLQCLYIDTHSFDAGPASEAEALCTE